MNILRGEYSRNQKPNRAEELVWTVLIVLGSAALWFSDYLARSLSAVIASI